MPDSFNRIWIHAICGTKNRIPLIHPKIENEIQNFIKNEFINLSCPVRIINTTPEHIHCLFLLNPQKSISEILKQIKGSSSFYINEQNLTSEKFEWQRGYAAYSVSDSVLEKIYKYILHQKEHHLRLSYITEIENMKKPST